MKEGRIIRRRMPCRDLGCRFIGIMLLSTGVWLTGCAANQMDREPEGPPAWANSVITAAETARVSPAMSTFERLTELNRAKEAAYGRLLSAVFALRLTDEKTIDVMAAARPSLHRQVEDYVRRNAVVNAVRRPQSDVEMQASVAVGAEFLDLLHVMSKPPPPDRNAPSTGVVHPY